MKKTLDFAATAERAKSMTAAELHYAMLDCSKAAAQADANERAGLRVEKDGGYYRDELSVYFKEQSGRGLCVPEEGHVTEQRTRHTLDRIAKSLKERGA